MVGCTWHDRMMATHDYSKVGNLLGRVLGRQLCNLVVLDVDKRDPRFARVLVREALDGEPKELECGIDLVESCCKLLCVVLC